MPDIIVEDDRWAGLDLHRLAKSAFELIFEDLDLPSDWDVTVLACDDTKIATLNSEFRDKDKATNVLSWPAYELAPETQGDMPFAPELDEFDENSLGDIAISYDTCLREAGQQGIDIADHTTHLLMHGCLHLLGFDHETDADATLMEGIESRLLEKLGISDPYKTEKSLP